MAKPPKDNETNRTRHPTARERALVEEAFRRVPGAADPANARAISDAVDEVMSIGNYVVYDDVPEWIIEDAIALSAKRPGRPPVPEARAVAEICYIYFGRMAGQLPKVNTRVADLSHAKTKYEHYGDYYNLVRDVFSALRLNDPTNRSRSVIAERKKRKARSDFW